MTILLLFVASCAVLALGYVFYGAFVERRLRMTNEHPTPAHEMPDGVDYVAAKDPVLFGHHFSSIAGAGPIAGPIIAGLAFGWLPALLWIVVGSIFVGGVHDFTSLAASIRHRALSIGEICRVHLNRGTFLAFMIFIWFTLLYVLIVFLDLTATTFAPAIPAGMEPAVAAARLRMGGAVATASVLYVVIAVVFGRIITVHRSRLGVQTLIFVPLVFAALVLGYFLPLSADHMPAILGSAKHTWCVLLLLYCFIASVTPVNILLQPRDYLSSFLLFACLAGGALGLLVGGLTGADGVALRYPAFLGIEDTHLGFIFPALFITVACGAVSGFHSIVASGTTAKQLDTERSARRIGYGSMLVEAVLAIVALATVMILAEKPAGGTSPVAVFANGMSTFLGALGLPEIAGKVFGLMAVSTFLLTTLDTCTRLTRFVLQELLGVKGRGARAWTTIASLVIPAIAVFSRLEDVHGNIIPAWQAIWPAFGATNQLMASLALLVVFTWLRSDGRKAWFVLLPMVFMFVTTLTALAQLAIREMAENRVLAIVSGLLGVLAVIVLVNTFLRFPSRQRAISIE